MNAASSQIENQVETNKIFFTDALRNIVEDFSLRAQEIIFARYGVFNSKAMTLEEIGKKYGITRERVRQVIREVLKKIRENKEDQHFGQIVEKIELALKENGGIMEKKNLLNKLGRENLSERAAANFFLECIDEIKEIEIKSELLLSFSVLDFDLEKWKMIKDTAIEILKEQKKPLSEDEIFKSMNNKLIGFELSKEILANFLEVSVEIKRNTFGKWGIAKWKEITPKGTREKAYLILKEAGKPLHFRDIAKKIDQYHLNKKKTHAQTVHNELIKDANFVLVGRGIYALAEWGYENGTVKDVIAEILKKSNKQMGRDEILTKVLELRHVKKSTIVINLNNYFTKSKGGMYSIKK